MTEKDILTALSKVMDPELGRNIVELTMVRDLKMNAGKVSFTLALTVLACPLKEKMAADARAVLMAMDGVTDVEITFAAMTDEERQKILGNGQPQLPKLNQFNKVKRVISIMSGKGGVGKSSVTATLAVALAREGLKVGILDADITGPSIPKVFGLPAGGVRGSEQGFLPAQTPMGIRVMSVNLLVKEDDSPVIWRGPMITSAIRQFWEETLWGKLDVLLIDNPPGTSDAAITVVQSLPLNGVMMVTTPQQLSGLVVRKAVNMIKSLNIPILGIIENMSYYPCPDTGNPHYIFGPSHVQEIAQMAGAPLTVQLPIDPQITALCDAGQAEQIDTRPIQPLIEIIAPALK